MKKSTFAFSLIIVLTVSILLSGFSFDNGGDKLNDVEHDESQETIFQKDKKIVKGITSVLTTMEEFQAVVKESPDDIEKINAFGKQVKEEWEKIEKKVEKHYPNEYKTIEESLYPLIDLSESNVIDFNELDQLIDETKMKLKKLADQIES